MANEELIDDPFNPGLKATPAEVRAVDALTAGLVDDGPRSLELGRAAAVSTASAGRNTSRLGMARKAARCSTG